MGTQWNLSTFPIVWYTEKGWNEEWERVQQIIHELIVIRSVGLA